MVRGMQCEVHRVILGIRVRVRVRVRVRAMARCEARGAWGYSSEAQGVGVMPGGWGLWMLCQMMCQRLGVMGQGLKLKFRL